MADVNVVLHVRQPRTPWADSGSQLVSLARSSRAREFMDGCRSGSMSSCYAEKWEYPSLHSFGMGKLSSAAVLQ